MFSRIYPFNDAVKLSNNPHSTRTRSSPITPPMSHTGSRRRTRSTSSVRGGTGHRTIATWPSACRTASSPSRQRATQRPRQRRGRNGRKPRSHTSVPDRSRPPRLVSESPARSCPEGGKPSFMTILSEPKIDCDFNVLDPAQFPCAPDASFRPSGAVSAPIGYFHHIMALHGIRCGLLVGTNSGYGEDLSPGGFAGVAFSGGRSERRSSDRASRSSRVKAIPSRTRIPSSMRSYRLSTSTPASGDPIGLSFMRLRASITARCSR